MADHDDTELACPEMPGWMREHAAHTEAAVATGSAPPGRSDDVAELEARVAELRERVHGANAGPGAPGDAENTAISQGALTEAVGEARTAVAARTAGQGGGGRGASAPRGLSYRAADDAAQRDTGPGWER